MNRYSSGEMIPAVDNFEIRKYLGKWYEIARIPHFFERSMDHVTAEYFQDENQRIHVMNRGLKHGTVQSIRGYVKPKNDLKTGELLVSFFRPFWSPYRVIAVDVDYTWAIVTGRDRSFLWILSRTPTISDDLLCRCMDMIVNWDFDTGLLEFPENG